MFFLRLFDGNFKVGRVLNNSVIYSYESLDKHEHKRKIKQINDKINDENINNIINKFNTSFNLYNNNCRHFANYCEKLINKINY